MSKRRVRGRLSYRSGRGYHVPRWYMRCVQQEIVRFSASLISVFELSSTLQRCADLALVMKVVHIKDHTTHAIRVAVGKLFQVLLMFQAPSSSSCTEFTQCFGGNTSIRTIDVCGNTARIPYLSCFWGMIHSFQSFHQIATISEVFDSQDQRLIILASCRATVWEAAFRCNAEFECVTRVVFTES